MNLFETIFKKYFAEECPPHEGNKKKQEGCFHALNNYGKEPDELNCMACWKECMTEIFWEVTGVDKK